MARLITATTAAVSLLLAGSARAKMPFPSWIKGNWPVEVIYQEKDKDYHPPPGPRTWWKNEVLRIDPQRIAFGDDVCEGPRFSLAKATLASLVSAETGGSSLADLGIPPQRGSIAYLSVKCDRELLRNPFDRTKFDTRDTEIWWKIVVQSHDRISMPFLAGTYVIFTRPSPTS